MTVLRLLYAFLAALQKSLSIALLLPVGGEDSNIFCANSILACYIVRLVCFLHCSLIFDGFIRVLIITSGIWLVEIPVW